MPAKKTFVVEERIKIALEDGDFNGASNTIERFLDENPTCSRAYLYRVLIEYKFSSIEELKLHGAPLDNNVNFKRAIEFATAKEKKELEEISNFINDRISNAKNRRIYNQAMQDLRSHKYIWAIEKFESIKDFEDASSKIDECKSAWEERKRVVRYKNAVTIANEARNNKKGIKKLEKAIELLSVNIEYENSKAMIESFKERILTIKSGFKKKKVAIISSVVGVIFLIVSAFTINGCVKKNLYNDGVSYFEKGEYKKAINIFEDLDDYKYSERYLELSESALYINKSSYSSAKNELIKDGYVIVVQYDSNGGTFHLTEKIITKTNENLIPSNGSRKYGYNFKEWKFYDWESDVRNKRVTFKYRAEYELATYTISYIDPTDSSHDVGTKVSTYTINDTVVFHTLESEGYIFEGWYMMQGNRKVYLTGFNPGDFARDLIVRASMVGKAQNIVLDTPDNGSIRVANQTVASGDTIRVIATPDAGYQLDKLYYVEKNSGRSRNIYGLEFVMPACEVTIYATFKNIKYTVTASVSSPHGIEFKEYYINGETFEVNIDVHEGYEVSRIYYVEEGDTTEHDINNGDSITINLKNITVYAILTLIQYDINTSATNGTISVKSTAKMGDTVYITCSPESGYYFGRAYYIVEGSSEEIEISSNRFTMPAKNVTVYCEFLEYIAVVINVDGTEYTQSVVQGKPLKSAFVSKYDLQHTMGYYSDPLCRNWIDPETIVYSGMMIYTKFATLDMLSFQTVDYINYFVSASFYTYSAIKDIVVPAQVNGKKVTVFNGVGELGSSHGLRGVYLPYGIREIGDYAFAYVYLENDTELYIPETVVNVGYGSFWGFGNGNNSVVFAGTVYTVEANAFRHLNSSLVFDFENVRTIDAYAFAEVDIGDAIVLNNVTSIGQNAFYKSTFKTIVITSDCTIGSFAFAYMEYLKSFEALNVTKVSGALFSHSTALTSVKLPNITKIENNMFFGCSSLSEFEIGSKVTLIYASAFDYTLFTILTIPTHVKNVYMNTYLAQKTTLESVILHEEIESLTFVGNKENCETVFYYLGSDEQYEKVSITSSIKDLVYIYSDEPIYDGKHWHYVEGIPTIYTQE